MNKLNNVHDFCRYAVIALLFQSLLGGCAGEIRYDGSKTYTLGLNENVTASYISKGDEKTKSSSNQGPGVTYSSQQDGVSYSSQQDGEKYTVVKNDDATAHYTLRPGELPPLQFQPVQHVTTPPASTSTPAQVEDVRIVLELSDVLFDFDKWVIKKNYYSDLDNWADYLLNNPFVLAEIQGHTDSTGPTAYNQKLSIKRANAVVNYLRGKGVAAKRLTVKGFGESRPTISNSTREGRQKNRRVEMHY